MRESTQSAADGAGMPAGSLSLPQGLAELVRLELAAHMAAINKQMRTEQRARFWRNLATLSPVALGLAMGLYAPLLGDLAAGYAPWAATLLFPLSALAAQHEIHLSLGAAHSLSQAMLYAQFPLDGLLAAMLLRQRSTLWSVCGQVIFLHALALLCMGPATGPLGRFLAN